MVIRMMNTPFDASFDALVHQELEKHKVPGLSISIVHGKNTYSKAYGVSEFPNKPMKTDSLFSTCSTTKAFTATAASLAIQDSQKTSEPFDWDTPIAELIRDDFVLQDEHATNHTTIEDAFSHRSGLPGHVNAMIWAYPSENLRDAVRKLRYLPLAYAPRSTWDYNNHLYMAVTHALKEKTGVELGEFLKQRIWDPLDMKDTYFSVDDVVNNPKTNPRLVRGYTYLSNSASYTPEPHINYPPTTGAGSIVSSVLEYAKWLRALIFHSNPPITSPVYDPLIKPRAILFENDEEYFPRLYHLYALGWFVDTVGGNNLYWHTGSWPGFGAMVGFLPEREFGFAIMGNSSEARGVGKVVYTDLLEKMLGIVDSQAPVAGGEKGEEEKVESIDEALKRLFPGQEKGHSVPPSLPLESYTGVYKHPGYGPIPVSLKEEEEGGNLTANLEDRVIATRIDLVHVNGEHFLGKSYTHQGAEGTSYFRVRFEVDAGGVVKRVGMDLEKALKGKMVWFERIG